jgi:signal transduction histidine kinase
MTSPIEKVPDQKQPGPLAVSGSKEQPPRLSRQMQVGMGDRECSPDDTSSLLNSIDIAIILLDTQFRIRRFTPAVKDLMELNPADIGRPIADLPLKFRDPEFIPDLQRVVEKHAPLEREIENDRQRTYVRRILPYRMLDHRVGGVVVTFVDISPYREAGAAKTANDHFLATLAHELRTPLAGIMLWTKLLREQSAPSPDEIREGLEAIQTCAAEQLELIEGLVDTSRIEEGKLRRELPPPEFVGGPANGGGPQS